MFVSASGTNSGSDDYAVGVAAASEALSGLNAKVPDVKPQFVLMFASDQYDQELVIQGAKTIFGPDAVIMGSSSAGEIGQSGYLSRPSVVMLALFSDDVHFVASTVSGLSGSEEGSANSITDILVHNAVSPPELLFYLYESLNVNASSLLTGATKPFGNAFSVAGFSASDRGTFKNTQQSFQEQKLKDSIVGVSLSGEVDFSITTAHGWNPLSIPKSVTSYSDNVLHTINNQPAVAVYEDYLGLENLVKMNFAEFFEIASTYPLGFYDNNLKKIIVRSPKAISKDGAIVFSGNIPENSYVQIMVGTPKEANQATLLAAKELKELCPDPVALIVSSSFIRKSLFGGRIGVATEAEQIQSVFGKEVPLIGSYTYGSFSPTDNSSKLSPMCLDGTVVLMALAKKSYG